MKEYKYDNDNKDLYLLFSFNEAQMLPRNHKLMYAMLNYFKYRYMIDDKNVFIMMTFKDNPMGKFNINDEEYYHNLARDVLLKNPLNHPY